MVSTANAVSAGLVLQAFVLSVMPVPVLWALLVVLPAEPGKLHCKAERSRCEKTIGIADLLMQSVQFGRFAVVRGESGCCRGSQVLMAVRFGATAEATRTRSYVRGSWHRYERSDGALRT